MGVLDWIPMKYRILDTVYRVLRIVLHYVFAIIYGWIYKYQKVPPISHPILQMSATELAKQIREKQLTSEVIVQTFINRITEVEPFINATVYCRFEKALKEAKEVDTLVASGTMTKEHLEKEKPLLGVPFSVKSFLKVKGLPCTSGSLYFKDMKAENDTIVVTQMRKAGAIVLVTTNTPELSMHIQTSNKIYGTTCNPYDTSKTCGGSSGGEGALISSAGSVIGIGNDLGGSVRIPCMFNGIFGHKPSRGLISNDGMFPPFDEIDSMISTGPMCRYSQDLVTMMKILSSPNENTARFGETVDFKDIKVYYMLSFGDDIPLTENVSSEMREAVNKVVSYFETHKGSKVKQLNIPQLKHGFMLLIHNVISSLPNTRKTLTAGKADVHGIRELLKFLCLRSKFSLNYIIALNSRSIPLVYDPSQDQFYKKLEKEIDDQLNDILDEKSILIMPTLPFPAPYHNEITLYIGSVCYTGIFNVLGMPSSQCPVGFNKQGLPVGVQIVSRRGNDHLTVAAAVEMEKAFGGWTPPN